MTRISEFHEKGYVVASGILDQEAIESLIHTLNDLAGPQQVAGGWTVPDGLTQTPSFWPLIFKEKLLCIVRELIGPDIRFIQHNDLHVGFSSLNWHRDSVSRKLGEGRDWDETEPYRIVRIGFYLQARGASPFRLGMLPGTHRMPPSSEARNRKKLEAMSGSLSLLQRIVAGRNPSPATAEWLTPAAGDAVIFDPRVLHTGSRTSGPKYSIFLAYGAPDSHSIDHAVYYRFLRPELDYQPMHQDLIEQLRTAGLYQEIDGRNWTVPGATLPGFIQSAVARRIRHRAAQGPTSSDA
jgi:Phytanoyl-CoA dioxygenase (PhyH)